MRILVFTTSYPCSGAPFNGVFVRAHARELVRRGHDVRLIAPWVFAADPEFEQEDGLTVRRVPYGSDGRLLSEHAGIPFALVARLLVSWNRTALTEARSWRPDVVHAHWAIPAGIPAARAARVSGTPLVVTVHGADMRLAAGRPESAGRVVDAVLRRADAVIAVSDAFASDVGRRPKIDAARVHTIPMGVDTAVFSPTSTSETRRRLGIGEDESVVLAPGALVPLKRFADVISALPEVLERHPNASLVIAGSGPEHGRLSQLAAQGPSGERVKFLGAIAQEELARWVNAADVVVLPSESEGLPVVLTEAAACGVPVVATDVGGSSEIVALHTESRLVQVGDVHGLAKALGDVLGVRQPDIRPSVIPAGSRYALAGAVDRIESIYGSLIAGRDECPAARHR